MEILESKNVFFHSESNKKCPFLHVLGGLRKPPEKGDRPFNWRYYHFYISISSLRLALNSTVSLLSKTVIFSISLLTSCSSYSISSQVCSLSKSVISSIRYLLPWRSAFALGCFALKPAIGKSHQRLLITHQFGFQFRT